MKFRSLGCDPLPLHTESGKGIRYNYNLIKQDGKADRLLKTPITDDLDGLIQASLDESLIYNIIARSKNDPSVLSVHKGVYADVSQLPHNLMEFDQFQKNAYAVYESLPKEVRANFGNSFDEVVKATFDGRLESYVNSMAMPSGSADPQVTTSSPPVYTPSTTTPSTSPSTSATPPVSGEL